MAGKRAANCSTNFSLIIKTVQNDNPCIIAFLCELKSGFVYPILNFNHITLFNISILLSVGSQKCSLLSHLETCGSTQPCVALWTAEFCTCFCVAVMEGVTRFLSLFTAVFIAL